MAKLDPKTLKMLRVFSFNGTVDDEKLAKVLSDLIDRIEALEKNPNIPPRQSDSNPSPTECTKL